jgi:CDP-diacylglycerol--glycerol-3-phosphate 3-phosphatidyltransferase
MLIIKPLSNIFFVIYIVCGISDVLDGYIARKTKTTSQFGAILDSIADIIFIGINLIIFIPLFRLSWWMIFWIGGIALVRLISLAIGFVKYNTVALLHTYANKATGFLLFCTPILYDKFSLGVTVCMVCSLASVSAIEELAINIVSKRLDRDIPCIIEIIKSLGGKVL